jgi:propanol-preferring alcohol dehydrogenase
VRAQVLHSPGEALREADLPEPRPGPGQLLVRVEACGVCRTDLHIVDGELPDPKLPLVLGHQIVGVEVETGARVGVPWLGWTDGKCRFCQSGRENLCVSARFTGYQLNGGYAEACLADAAFVYPLPAAAEPARLAPLLCAGVVGYRALRLSGAQAGTRLGLYGFGGSAHLVLQVAIRELGCRVLVFTRGAEHRRLALDLGAEWAGGAQEVGSNPPGGPLDAAIIFAPAGGLVPLALQALGPGGRLVLAGIYMSPIPQLAYDLVWHERSIHSVANATRQDAQELLALATQLELHTEVETLSLAEANLALARLRAGQVRGALVLVP